MYLLLQRQTDGMGIMEDVYLKDVGTYEDPCMVVCSKGDPGAVLYKPAGY